MFTIGYCHFLGYTKTDEIFIKVGLGGGPNGQFNPQFNNILIR